MAEQLSLMGFEPAASPTDRLFFAIQPDIETATRIVELAHDLRHRHGLKGAPLAAERLHVTLWFLGDFVGLPQAIIAGACEAASHCTWPAFDVTFDRVLSFQGGRRGSPFVLRSDDKMLIEFQRTLALMMSKAGVAGAANKAFVPHVTLLYDTCKVAEQRVETIHWAVRELVLVRSVLGQSRHEPIARWPLSG
ncbi:MAG: 2,5 ligase [Rhodocyclales bacterium]|nr:2,5 ligase [Rhodocyclales bacterium]MDB5887485.1 2,5 ligase [Rhodocyclales bacterium]